MARLPWLSLLYRFKFNCFIYLSFISLSLWLLSAFSVQRTAQSRHYFFLLQGAIDRLFSLFLLQGAIDRLFSLFLLQGAIDRLFSLYLSLP